MIQNSRHLAKVIFSKKVFENATFLLNAFFAILRPHWVKLEHHILLIRVDTKSFKKIWDCDLGGFGSLDMEWPINYIKNQK